MLSAALSLDFLGSFWTGVIVIAGIYCLLALGLQLNVGFTGIINFGSAGFMAIGGYSMAILVVNAGFSFWLALPSSMAITVLFGLLVGLPSLRLRADYFAIATIAASEVVRLVALNAQGLTNGSNGLYCSDASDPVYRCYDDTWLNVSDKIQAWVGDLGFSDVPSLIPLAIVTWIIVGIVTLGLVLITRTPWGRVLRAVREDEDAAKALGKNTYLYKLQSLAICAAIGSIAGWLLALNVSTIHPTDYEPLITFFAYSVLVLGGLASYRGLALSALVFAFLTEAPRYFEFFQQEDKNTALRFALAGLILILLMVFRPQGMAGKREEMVLGD
jgi:branched-chain amino acid transport system permease protein